jgi:hypothetical protein
MGDTHLLTSAPGRHPSDLFEPAADDVHDGGAGVVLGAAGEDDEPLPVGGDVVVEEEVARHLDPRRTAEDLPEEELGTTHPELCAHGFDRDRVQPFAAAEV